MLVSRMKKFILYIIFFFAIITSIDYCFGRVCDYLNAHSQGGMSKQIYDMCMKDEYDVIILGSSRAHHHYVPQIMEDSLGMSCYNAGFDGNGIIMMYGLYKMITSRYTPKLIIYDVEQMFDLYKYENDKNCTRYLNALKPYYNQPCVLQIFKDISIKEYYKVHSGFCRYNSNTFPLALDYLKKRPMDDRGYSPLIGTFDYEPVADERKRPLVVDPLKMNYMLKLIREVSERAIPIVVVASPRYGVLDSDEFIPLKKICEDYKIRFVDFYSDDYFLSHKELFNEPVHLNDNGARIFTQKIASLLKQEIVN